MSRQISRRYLLFYLSVSAILVCGSSRRIPREASCPSCSQDCPEALTVQLPWNPQDSNLRDFSINSLRNSPSHSQLIQEGTSQDLARDDNISLNQNSISFGNYRRFPQQQPTQNFFFKNYLNNSPKSLDRQKIFSQDKPAKEYPLVVPSRQDIFERSKNLFFRNPRNKYSESLSEDYKRTGDNKKIEEDPSSKVLVVYRADRDTKPFWKNSRDTLNVIQSERSFPKIENIYRLRQEDVLNEKRNAIEKSSNSASQFRYPQERYNPIGFSPSQVEHPYVKDTDISQSTKEFLDNWDVTKDSSQSSNLGQLRNNLLEVYPVKKPEIIAKNNNEQINSNSYNSKFHQDLNIWESKKDGELFDSLMRINTKPFENEDDEDMKEYFEDETKHFMNGEDINEYFENETGQDTIETERDNYNPHVVLQNIWKDAENEQSLDDLDFTRENSQEIEQSKLYSEENDKYLQDEQNEDVILQDKAYFGAEAAHAPVINAYNAYIIPQYLNIVNDKKYPTKSETQELSEAKNNVRTNLIKEMNQRFFENEAVIENNMHIQDLPKDIFNLEKYNSPISDTQNNVRNKNETPIELDPDLLDDIEDPPMETTESTPI